MKRIFLIILAVFVIFSTVQAQEDGENKDSNSVNKEEKSSDTGTQQGFYFNNSLGFSYNYLGLALNTYAFYRIPLVKDKGVLWRNTKLDIGLNNYFTPSYERISFFMAIEPIAFFDVKSYVGYDQIYKVGDAGAVGGMLGPGMRTVNSLDAEYNSDGLDAVSDADKLNKGGLRIVVKPRLKAAYGNFIALYTFKIDYHKYSDVTYYYDPGTFKINKGTDTILTHDGTVIYKIKLSGDGGTVMTGLNYNHFYANSNSDNSSIRLTALVVYTPNWSFAGKPYFVVQVGTHLSDKYHQYDPYVAILAGIDWKVF